MSETNDSPSPSPTEGSQQSLLSAKRSAAGRKGGKSTRARHGTEHYKAIGKRGGEVTHERHGEGHYREAGRRGGEAASARAATGGSDLATLIDRGRGATSGDLQLESAAGERATASDSGTELAESNS